MLLRYIRNNVGWIKEFEIVKLPMKGFTICCTTNYLTIQQILHKMQMRAEAQKEVEKAVKEAQRKLEEAQAKQRSIA